MAKAGRVPTRVAASALVGAAVLGWAVLPGTPAYGATATGCSGHATSVNRQGQDMDSASAPGRGGTEADPLKIDSRGTIDYDGRTDSVIKHGSWKVDIYGLDSISGKITNDSGETTRSGTAEVHKYLHIGFGPFNTVITGKYHVTFSATGEGGASCSVDAYIDIVDSPINSPFFALASLMILVAILLLVIWGRPEMLVDIIAGDYQGAIDDMGKSIGV